MVDADELMASEDDMMAQYSSSFKGYMDEIERAHAIGIDLNEYSFSEDEIKLISHRF